VASLPFRPCFQPVHQALVPLGRHTGPLLSEYKYKAKQAKRRQQQPTKLTNSVLLLVFVSQCPHKTSHRTIYLSAIVWCGPLLTLSSNREISQQESFSQASTKRAQDCLCPKKRFHSAPCKGQENLRILDLKPQPCESALSTPSIEFLRRLGSDETTTIFIEPGFQVPVCALPVGGGEKPLTASESEEDHPSSDHHHHHSSHHRHHHSPPPRPTTASRLLHGNQDAPKSSSCK
jgi:hypothetical protein